MPSSSARGERLALDLSWGEASDEPRSSVRDADGAMVFRGSPVRTLGRVQATGVVASLLSRTEVRIDWHDAPDVAAGEPIAANRIVVTGPFPGDRRPWAPTARRGR